MITCQHAHQLFDRYLDGELSASLQTELHAHRLNCSVCQNELAMLEACGDVIAMDRCEPQVGVSFTDRVLMAQRQRQPVRRPRWSRKVLYLGSPMAAAASIALLFFALSPQTPVRRPGAFTDVKGAQMSIPKSAQDVVVRTRDHSVEAQLALDATPTMSEDNFLDAILASFVERSKSTVEGTLLSAKDFQGLIRRGLSDTNAMLIAGWQATQQNQDETSDSAGDAGLDLLDPNTFAPPANNNSTPAPAKDRENYPEML